jgi:MFS family permease
VLLALVASGVADGFLPVALSFAVLRVTGSTGRLGLVLATQSILGLLLTLAGGLAGDRFARKRVLTASLSARLAVAVVLAATLLTGSASFALLIVMSGIYGCADGFYGPASTAMLPEVVPRDQLARANALVGGSTSALRVAAPGAAGVVVAGLGTGAAFVVQAAILATAVGCLAVVRPKAGPRPSRRESVGPLAQLRAGWKEFVRIRWLWLLTSQWTAFSLIVLSPLAVLGPAIALRDLGGPASWGLINSCLAFGAIGGQVVAGRITAPRRPALVVVCLVPVIAGEALALGLGASLAVVALATVGAGAAFGFQTVLFATAMQTAVQPAMLSRVAAIDLLGSEGGQPVGYALAGPIGAAVGAHLVLVTGAVVMFAGSVAFAFLPSLRAQIPGDPWQPT